MIDLRKSAELNGVEPIELYTRFMRFPQSEKLIVCYCNICGKERILPYHGYHSLCKKCASCTVWARLKRREAAIERFKNLDEREKASIRTTNYFKVQDNRDRAAVSANKRWSDPLERENAKEKANEQWNIQENREKASAREQGIPYEEWEDFIYNQEDGRKTAEVRRWKSNIFERDNYTCQICYEHGCYLNAHHIRKWSEYPELRLDINNGITLCVDCHLETYYKEDEYINFLEKRVEVI